MFLLHERTRKSLCRIGFVLLCVLPTCAVALWAASRNGDGHRARCEAEMSRLLGLKVALGKVEYPEPGVVRYLDLLLADRETDAAIASAAELEVRSTATAVVISSAALKIALAEANALAELLHDRLRDRTETGETPIRLAIGELTIAAKSGDVSLLGVSARLEATREGRGAQVAFRTAEMSPEAAPAVMTMVRSRQARIGFELETQGAFPLPAAPVGSIVQLLRTLVGSNEVLVPVTPEAQALLRLPPP
jgi:hypothetical protein